MNYATGTAFRRALEDRFRRHSLDKGEPLFWLRKMVAFDRYLARLVASNPDVWLLKGGMALQLRLGERARTTKDLDVLAKGAHPALHQVLVEAALLDLDDWFAIDATFAYWATHPLPASIPRPPNSWKAPFRRMATDIGLLHRSLNDASVAMQSFIDPVLHNREDRLWDAATWSWTPVN